MALEQVKVRELVRQSVSKSVDIPEFQRAFVWDAEQVKKLAESLYRDYPIGSLLLWDSSDYKESKVAQGTQASLWIVDGQQRTTALCLLLGQKPYWWDDAENWNEALERFDVMVNVCPDQEGEYLEFSLPNPVRHRDPRWISLRRIVGTESIEALTGLAQEIVKSLGGNLEQQKQMELFSKIHARLQRLWQIRERDIPIIKISHEVEDVAEIFTRLNQEGTRVKEADVILALAAVRNPGWVRNEYLPFRNELEEHGWDLGAGIFVRTMTGIARGRARLREVPRDFWNSATLLPVWGQAKNTIIEVTKRLLEKGVIQLLLPSSNSLIPLFVLHHRYGGKPGYRFEKALYWFLFANRDGRYSGSAITTLDEDLRIIHEKTDFDQAVQELLQRLRVPLKVTPDDFRRRYDRWSNGFERLVLYMLLIHEGACDWIDKTRIGYDKTGALIAAGFEPQWHHIYPRSVLRREGMTEEEIHALANVTVLNERTNVNRLAGKEPGKYIAKYDISPELLRGHLIPDSFAQPWSDPEELQSRWSMKHYKDFLSERAELIAQKANQFLHNLNGA